MARGKLNQGEENARRVRVGLVLIVSLLFLGYGIFQVGRLFDVFATRYPLFTELESSSGLIEGAPVTLAGQRVGQVDAIRFLPVEQRTDSATVVVRMSVSEDVQAQIRDDSRAALQTQGLLGSKYLDITPGSAGGRVLDPGDTLPSADAVDYESVLRTAASTMEYVQDVVVDLRAITDGLASGEGTLGSLLVDDALYRRMTTATNQLAALLGTVRTSDGTLTRLIEDPTLYRRLTSAVAQVDSLGEAVLAGEGTLGRLVRDDSLYQGLTRTVEGADSALADMETVLRSVSAGEGTLGRLMEDPELYDQLLKAVTDLQALVEQLRQDPEALSPEIRVF